MYRTTKTASVHINLGAITFSSISQKDPSNLFYMSPCELSGSIRVPHLARSSLRYDCHPLSLPLWSRLLKIDETPVNIVEIVI